MKLLAVAVAVLLVPASAQAMPRSQAERIARGKVPKGAVLHSQLLARGARVDEAGPGPKTRVRTQGTQLIVTTPYKPVKARTWLVWADLLPGARFEHPSVLVLVDDRSGRVVRRQPMAFYPLVNGRRPAFMKAATAVARAAVTPPNLSADCMVVIGDRLDPMFAGDFALARQVAAGLKLTVYEAQIVADLRNLIAKAQARGCRDVMLYVTAHGSPATGTNYLNSKTGVAVAGTDHATAMIGGKVSGDSVILDNLDATYVRALMQSFPALTFKLVVDTCFAGRWIELGDVPNLRVIVTSSRSDQFSYGYWLPVTYERRKQENGVTTNPGGSLVNRTTNHTHAGGFSNGLFRGLDAWAHDERRPTDDLAKGIADAFRREGEWDFAAQLGATNPQIADHTADVPAPAPPVPPAKPVPTPTPVPQVNRPPEVALNLSTTAVKAGQPVHMVADASDADGYIKGLKLVYGDGSQYVLDERTDGVIDDHTYSAPGVYEVTFSATDDDGATSTTDVQRIFVSGPGTKSTTINDIPCPVAGFYVEFNIPSYASTPTATFSGTPCAGGTVMKTREEVVGTNPAELDEWGQPKKIFRVEFTVSGATSTSASVTVTAHWQ